MKDKNPTEETSVVVEKTTASKKAKSEKTDEKTIVISDSQEKKALKAQIKKEETRVSKSVFLKYFCRITTAVILLVLFVFPLGMESINLGELSERPALLHAYNIPFLDVSVIQNSVLHILYFLVYFLPFTSLFLLISFFIRGENKKLLYILVLISLSVYLFVATSTLLIFANCERWFLSLPWYVYACFGFAFFTHGFMSISGMIITRNRKPEYAEYKRVTSEDEQKTKYSIKTKLKLVILISLFSVITSLIYLILSNNKKMFIEAVSDMGRTRAEQTANVYDSADGMYEKILQYFDQQRDNNLYSDLPFERIDIIISDIKDNLYLEEITAETELHDYNVFAYSTSKPSKVPEADTHITKEQAADYIRRIQNGTYKRTPVFDKATKTLKYIYPVTFQRKAGHKLVGFSIVTYRQEVLMKSLFKTEVFVFVLSAIFLYLAIILTIFISDFIANPLLYLRSNVKKTSQALSKILEKKSEATADTIIFEDTIRTQDEIKDLSLEISDMVSLIRGMVPYISFSTLKNAEQNKIERSISKDLCFLFTDIRGFTSLCEGKQPKDVVDILNHYLNIETDIILRNGGDIDKFVGDEMMAFFAGPRKEINACKAAMEIRAAMRSEQEKALNEKTDFISMGIGINTGKVTFGSVGSKQRMDFTSIGDVVNLAARLESANKIYSSKSIITEAVYVKLKDMFVCRELDFITVKGKTEPVRIYEILQMESIASENVFDIKKLFESGLKEYRKKNWEKAEQYFMQCDQKYNDDPSKVFLNRIHHFKFSPPPEKWDGVFVSQVK